MHLLLITTHLLSYSHCLERVHDHSKIHTFQSHRPLPPSLFEPNPATSTIYQINIDRINLHHKNPKKRQSQNKTIENNQIAKQFAIQNAISKREPIQQKIKNHIGSIETIWRE